MPQPRKHRTTLSLSHKSAGARGHGEQRAVGTEALPRSSWSRLEKQLRDRERVLLGEIRDTLLRVDAERYANIADQVRDTKDQAAVELLVDISHAEVDRDLGEVRDIDAALRRIATGSYGICAACGTPIVRERLEAYPTAKRCLSCQQLHEHSRAQPAEETS